MSNASDRTVRGETEASAVVAAVAGAAACAPLVGRTAPGDAAAWVAVADLPAAGGRVADAPAGERPDTSRSGAGRPAGVDAPAETPVASHAGAVVPAAADAVGARRRNGRPVPGKILPHLRKRPVPVPASAGALRSAWLRLAGDSHRLRTAVQAAFVLLCVWIGIEFHLFMEWGMSRGAAPFFERPPGVEGFLPISALISLKYWAMTGTINTIHPSGLFILLAIAATGLLLKKAFCSWLCPVGTLSESLWMLGEKVFGRTLALPRWLDYPLRSLKYLLLAFFAWAIWQMDVPSLEAFIHSPYNKMADVKMYLFFAAISRFALWTIVVLMVLSVVIKNFWCRYLCPYGALLGMLSWASPLKITRTRETCIDCELCTRACPARIPVHRASRVRSDECTACMECVKACPVIETLELRAARRSAAVPAPVLAALVVGLFVAVTGLAMLTGHWQNSIGRDEYQRRFKEINSPLYQHNRGEVPAYGPAD
jgi:polyferredoxin